jgi:hypothetical protein
MIATTARQIREAQQRRGYEARVLLEETRATGFGLVVAHPIRRGQVIALYPIIVIAEPGCNTKDPLKEYFIEVVDDGSDEASSTLVGRPDLREVRRAPTGRKIPSTGLFANEPGRRVPANAELTADPRPSRKVRVKGASRFSVDFSGVLGVLTARSLTGLFGLS